MGVVVAIFRFWLCAPRFRSLNSGLAETPTSASAVTLILQMCSTNEPAVWENKTATSPHDDRRHDHGPAAHLLAASCSAKGVRIPIFPVRLSPLHDNHLLSIYHSISDLSGVCSQAILDCCIHLSLVLSLFIDTKSCTETAI